LRRLFHLFSIIDVGDPKSVTVTTEIKFDYPKDPVGTPPRMYGALGTPAGQVAKPRRGSPVAV
jgi:hypothetical protein